MIYHYTNTKGLMGILNRDKGKVSLRFTDYRYLNDISEGCELQEIYDSVCESMHSKGIFKPGEYETIREIDFDDTNTFMYYNDITETRRYSNVKSRCYICCFCQEGDNLDIWRYYSKGDVGYAIGFDEGQIKQELSVNQTYAAHNHKTGKFLYGKVLYDREDKEKKVADIIRKEIVSYREYKKCMSHTYDLKQSLRHDLMKLRMMIKNPCFKSEDETRLILETPATNESYADKEAYSVSFREQKGVIVPYIDVELPLTSVRSIKVAPIAADNSLNGVRDYLEGFIDDVELSRSTLPIRF